MIKEQFTDPQISSLRQILSYVSESGADYMTERIVSEIPGALALCEADFHRIASVTGDEGAAHIIRLIIALNKRRRTDEFKTKRKYSDEGIRRLAAALLFGCPKETLAVLALDQKERLVAHELLSSGSANASGITPRILLDIAEKRRASALIVAHNHLNGDLVPSQEDVQFTKQMKRVLDAAGVKLLAHYVVAGGASRRIESDFEYDD